MSVSDLTSGTYILRLSNDFNTFIKKIVIAKMILETERFILREFELADAKFMYELNNDPEVIKYTGDPPFSDLKDATNFLENYTEYQNHGFGRWACILKVSGEFTGWCGLKMHAEEDYIDLGFRFFRKFLGQGICYRNFKGSN